MIFWKFPYAKRYYFSHPSVFIKDVFLSLKYAWQRATRGWDDYSVWSIDGFLCTIIPEMLTEFKKDSAGYPVQFFGDSDQSSSEIAWDTALDKMIAGFVAGHKYISGDLPVYEEAYAIIGKNKPVGFNDHIALFSQAIDDLGRDRIDAERKELIDKFNIGMSLFTQYFFDLWW